MIFPYIRADGSSVWAQLYASPLIRRDGSVLGIAHVIDITTQLEAATAVERQQALDQALSMVRLSMLRGASAQQGLALICEAASECLAADRALILTEGTEPDELEVAAAFNVGPEARSELSFQITQGTVGEVFRSGIAQSCGPQDLRYTPRNRAVIDRYPVESIVMAPIQAFASEAVVAIGLAAVVEAQRRLELLEDRDRIGRDMHDNVIGRLFGTGMNLQATASRADADLQARILSAVEEIGQARRSHARRPRSPSRRLTSRDRGLR